MVEEADVMKFLRRRTEDDGLFWKFLITLTTIIALIFYFGGAPNTKNFRQREKVMMPNVKLSETSFPKVSIRKVMNAAIEMAILGGEEVVKVR